MLKNRKFCKATIKIYEDTGDFSLSELSDNCGRVIKKINPVRGVLWKRGICVEDKKKHNLED